MMREHGGSMEPFFSRFTIGFWIRASAGLSMVIFLALIAFGYWATMTGQDLTLALRGDGLLAGGQGAVAVVDQLDREIHLVQRILLIGALTVIVTMVLGTIFLDRLFGRYSRKAKESLETLARGDLRFSDQVHPGARNELCQIVEATHEVARSLTRIVAEIREDAKNSSVAAQRLAAGSTDLAQRTDRQAAALAEVSAAVEEITATVEHNAKSAHQAFQASSEAQVATEEGGNTLRIVLSETHIANQEWLSNILDANRHFSSQLRASSREMVGLIANINESSVNVSGITGVINDLAFQTSLLALNASVEAARAGEHGRGFAVVATEIRKLASRSTKASEEIGKLIEKTLEQVQAGSKRIKAFDQAMDGMEREIAQKLDESRAGMEEGLHCLNDLVAANLEESLASATQFSGMMENIKDASAQQAVGISQVAQAILDMDKITFQNAALAGEISQTGQDLVALAQELTQEVGAFTIKGA